MRFALPERGRFFSGGTRTASPRNRRPCASCPGARPPRTEVTGGAIDLPDKGLALALSKPSWMKGGEIGVNEKGVVLGNEAVFSRLPVKKDGILGMDVLRAALCSAATAGEAVAILVDLTERFEQGGNGAFQGKLYYHNSYLITGFDGAYVLETAAHRWAWKKLKGPVAISNSYSLGLDYKRLDAETRKAIFPVNAKFVCSDEADAGHIGQKEPWKPYIESRFHAFFTKDDVRRRALVARIGEARPDFAFGDAFAALRARALPDPARPERNAVIYAHDRDDLGYPTTASLIMEYGSMWEALRDQKEQRSPKGVLLEPKGVSRVRQGVSRARGQSSI
jgi:secernin